jgi:hypothetical protein
MPGYNLLYPQSSVCTITQELQTIEMMVKQQAAASTSVSHSLGTLGALAALPISGNDAIVQAAATPPMTPE